MRRTLTTYEHQTLKLGPSGLCKSELSQLQAFHGNGHDFPYYRLIHGGVKFRSYVGVLRVGGLTIEILPKVDSPQNSSPGEAYWRDRLLEMLRVVHDLPLHSPSTAHLRTRPHDVLHLYLRVLLERCENLYRRGLHRAYREERANASVLSGRLLFTEHLRHNLVHKERFFVARDRFDFDTPHNRLLGQALRVAARLNDSRELANRFSTLIEYWPELPETRPSPAVFDRLTYPRGTEIYRSPLAIARLILLRHAPDSTGGRDLPALLFNINRLWEAFLERALRHHLREYSVSGQRTSHYFHTGNYSSTLRPDITISQAGEIIAILDAKWKVPSNDRPSSGDLQQLYTYAHFHGIQHVALLYPGTGALPRVQGRFGRATYTPEDVSCTISFLPLPREESAPWSAAIAQEIRYLVERPT